MMKKVLWALLAGAAGGLANSLAVWIFGVLGISPMLGFRMMPSMSLLWLTPRLFFGALWGLLFLLPVLDERPCVKGAVLSLLPSAYMLLKVFPHMGHGMMGFGLGPSAPFFVLLFNLVWGVTAAYVWWYGYKRNA